MSPLENQRGKSKNIPHRILRLGALAAIAAALLMYTWPLLAAVEFIQPFTVTTTSNSISMSWITRSEYNVAGFEILCKLEQEPESSYHLIQSVSALGGLNQSASYAYTLGQGFDPGVSYCFRLREVTSDAEPGDYFDRCGYGLNITPTPGAAPTFTPVVVITTTATITGALPITGSQTITDANGNVVTVTPTPPAPVNNSPLPSPVFNSPLPAPEMTLTAQAPGINPQVAATAQALGVSPELVLTAQASFLDPEILAVAQDVGVPIEMLDVARAANLSPALVLTAVDYGLNPPTLMTAQAGVVQPDVALTAEVAGLTPEAVYTAQAVGLSPALVMTAQAYDLSPDMLLTAQAADSSGQATATPTFTPSATWTLPPVQQTPTFTPSPTFTFTPTQPTPNVGGGPSDGAQAPGGAQPAYVVWTATPTAPPLALQFAFTPLPTVTSTPGFNLAQMLAPTNESVIVMALCFIFFGASGLGIAGLITSALYVRSRKRNGFFGD
ncbi:MAG: hypothetical protein R3A44_19880 [Caldilineaceae bacterium]